MYKYTLFTAVLFTQLFSGYDVGDTMSTEHQDMEFSYCYPSDSSSTTFSFSKNTGKVFMLERSAAWWAPCFDLIPEGEDIYEYWKDDNRVEIIHFLDDYGSGNYSCTQWGNAGSDGIPPLIDDGTNNTVFSWFENQNDAGLGSLVVFIDHTMKIIEIFDSAPSFTLTKIKIQNMLVHVPEMSMSLDDKLHLIDSFNIIQLYPNPFNPILKINFVMASSRFTQVNIMGIGGNHIESLYSGSLQSGSHEMSWNAESMPSGVYLVSLKMGAQNLTEKVVLLK